MANATHRDALPAASAAYWEQRAQRFAARQRGLPAVCSFGMPLFYNRFIDASQRLALARWLEVERGARVLDFGCGVGRWSIALARRGARVLGIDISPSMLAQARRNAATQGVASACRFELGDLAALELTEKFDLVIGVTVLQHVLDGAAFASAVRRLAGLIEPGGRLVLLEAAPSRHANRCDTAVFVGRTLDTYLEHLIHSGLQIEHVGGVDPAPFKTWLLPCYRKLPAWIGIPALALATLLSAPIDLPFGRALVAASWHKVIVARANGAR